MEELAGQIMELFEQTGEAHHQAFAETKGFDPEWPLWYADYMHNRLSDILDASFTKSEMVYLLIVMDKEQRLHAPGANWRRYYTNFLIERYL